MKLIIVVILIGLMLWQTEASLISPTGSAQSKWWRQNSGTSDSDRDLWGNERSDYFSSSSSSSDDPDSSTSIDAGSSSSSDDFTSKSRVHLRGWSEFEYGPRGPVRKWNTGDFPKFPKQKKQKKVSPTTATPDPFYGYSKTDTRFSSRSSDSSSKSKRFSSKSKFSSSQ